METSERNVGKIKQAQEFAMWDRKNLEQYAADAYNEIESLKEELKLALDAWRDEVKRINYENSL
jgi:hypothetical protein